MLAFGWLRVRFAPLQFLVEPFPLTLEQEVSCATIGSCSASPGQRFVRGFE